MSNVSYAVLGLTLNVTVYIRLSGYICIYINIYDSIDLEIDHSMLAQWSSSGNDKMAVRVSAGFC